MRIPTGRLEIAAALDPFTRPGSTDWTAGPDVLSVHLSYGVRGQTGEPEPSEMTVVVDDPDRMLDPNNTSSALYPNVKLRRRCRVVATPAGDDDRVVLTGHIASISRSPGVDTNIVTLELDDLLAITAATVPGTTVADIGVLAAGPWGYWPLGETAGQRAADTAGSNDGTYMRSVATSSSVIPYDERGLPEFAWSVDSPSQRVELPSPETAGVTVDYEATFVFELALPQVSASAASTTGLIVWQAGAADPRRLYDATALTEYNQMRIHASWNVFEAGTRYLAFEAAWGGGSYVGFTMPLDVFDDGRPHQVAVRLDDFDSRSSSAIFVDGEARSGDVTTTADIALDTYFGTRVINAGAIEVAVSDGAVTFPELAFTLGRIVEYTRALTDDEIVALWTARNAPWDGDRTGARLARVATLVGIDPLDIDLDAGLGICGPAEIAGQTWAELVDAIAATEAGYTYCTPEGRIRLRPRTTNNPTPIAIYGNHPTATNVVLHEPIDREFGAARTVNVARVSWPGADEPQVVRNDTSTAVLGELSIDVNTVARTPAGARAVGQRLVYRSGEPREQIDTLRIIGALSRSTLATTLDIGPGDAILLDEDDVATLMIVERVEQDWRAGVELTTTLGVREHPVFPTFKFDTVGQGFDVAVWSNPSREAALPGKSASHATRRIRRRRRSPT